MRKVAFLLFGLWGAINCIAQTIIIAPKFENSRGFSEGLAVIKQNGKWGYVNVKGELAIPAIYVSARDFHEGKAAVKTENGWGYINADNKMVIPDKFYDARDFSEGLAAVKSSIKTDKFNDDGYEGEYYGHYNDLESWRYIKEDGTLAFEGFFRDISTFHDGVACVFNEKNWYYINKRGSIVYRTKFDNYYPVHYSDGLIPNIGGTLGDEWGFSDLSGKWIIKPQYRSVTEFSDGLAITEEFGGKKIVINNAGNTLYSGVNDRLTLLKGGYILDGNNLYHKDNFSKPYATIEMPSTYWQLTDIVTIPSGSPGGASAIVDYKAPLNIQSVEILRSLKAISFKQPGSGLWATEFDNGYWGFTTLNMQDYISQYVSSHMDIWLKRGEFESASAYENRTSVSNRQQKEVALADDLINKWLKKGLDKWTLSNYDADNEIFTLTTDLGTYKIKIPVGSARRLKDNWASVNKQVGFKYENGLSLAKIDFVFSQGSKDMTLSVNTATGTIQEVENDKINKDLPSIKWLDFMATTTNKECPIKLGVNSKSKIESVSISVNGIQDRGIKTVNSSDYDLTINRTLTLNEGTNVIKVSVRNATGTTQEEKTIVYRPQGGELPTIEWLDFAVTANKKEYQMKLGIKSKTKVEEVNVTVNGALTRGIKPVPTDGYDLKVDRTLALSEGVNRIVVSVRNGDGIATSEKVITYQGINPTPIFNDKRIAFVVGNSHYSNSEMNLANPENDARDVAEKLKGLGFEVVLKLDATKENMEKELSVFGEKAKDYDVAMFYYAGHGIQSKGVNYLIPTNINDLAENNLKWKCVNIEQVLDVMEDSQCKLKIVVLDACRNDPLSRKWHRSTATRGLSIMSSPIGTIIAYSTAPGMTAQDGTARNSPYTEAFLNTLDQPNLDISNFFQEVMAHVTKKTNHAQNPWWSSSYTGKFYFNKQ